MKKVLLIMLSVAAVLILAGFGMIAAGGFRPIPSVHTSQSTGYERLAEPLTEEQTADASQCKNIVLDSANTKLEIIPCDGDQIRLSYETIYRNEWTYSFSDGTLQLKNTRTNSIHSLSDLLGFIDSFNFTSNGLYDGNEKHTVTLSLPKGVEANLNVTNVNGSVNVSGLDFQAIRVEIVNSELKMQNVTCKGTVRINDVNGQVQMTQVKASVLNFDSLVNGGCELQSPEIADIRAHGFVNSSLEINGVPDPKAYRVKYSLVNGGIKIGDQHFSGSGSYGDSAAKNSLDIDGTNTNLTISQ